MLRDDLEVVTGDLSLQREPSGAWILIGTFENGDTVPIFDLEEVMLDASESVSWWGSLSAQLLVSSELAERLSTPADAGLRIGEVALLSPKSIESVEIEATIVDSPDSDGMTASLAGPDVIVGDISGEGDPVQLKKWGKLDEITAFSMSTTSCNIGTVPLKWIANTQEHPVIAQNVYRLKSGRFEQIGYGWLKHGFFALSQSLCSSGCRGFPNGDYLGVNCSDPYSASLNGGSDTTFPFNANLGPRYEVNASTGVFLYPFSPRLPPCNTVICRRIQIQDADLDPAENAGARYFAEAHYVTPDDAAAGNQHNNASYRELTLRETGPGDYLLLFTAGRSTQRQKPGIQAWKDYDASSRVTPIDVPVDGRFWLGYKTSSLGLNQWHFEYAVQNLNSDRSASSFSVPIPDYAVISNVGFHDIDQHSGSPLDSTDWVASEVVVDGQRTIQWQMVTLHPPANPANANALRWGSLYNFRFDADAPPTNGSVSLGLFKAGDPTTMTTDCFVPGGPLMILSSAPPDSAIDAGQPHGVDDLIRTGWFQFRLELNVLTAGTTAAHFELEQVGGDTEAPEVQIALPDAAENTVVLVVLTDPISVGARSTLRHIPSGAEVHAASLPGDVTADGIANLIDVEALAESLSPEGVDRPLWSKDINRSGQANPQDLIRLMDVLVGAGTFEAHLDLSLPPA